MSQSFKRDLAKRILDRHTELEGWFSAQARLAPTPFYSSVDLRDSGHKIVPVDSNLFPAGFNNICPADQRTAPDHFKKSLSGVRRLVVIPEEHTRNVFYNENVTILVDLLKAAGIEVELGRLGESSNIRRAELADGPTIVLENGFAPDAILLNNDFSAGVPDILNPQGWSKSQRWLTPISIGWHARKKSEHFRHYNALATEFANIIGIDPWHIRVETEEVAPVNFDSGEGVEDVARVVGEMLQALQAQHAAHDVKKPPYVYVKNNAGTYGMGIMTAHSAEDIRTMNRRTKNKMSTGKGSVPIRSVCVQEGVPSTTRVDGNTVAEPVIYLAACNLLGGFLRSNPERDDESNLNSQGMVFKKLCMTDLNDRLENEELELDPIIKGHLLELVYGSVARLSALAAGREMAALGAK